MLHWRTNRSSFQPHSLHTCSYRYSSCNVWLYVRTSSVMSPWAIWRAGSSWDRHLVLPEMLVLVVHNQVQCCHHTVAAAAVPLRWCVHLNDLSDRRDVAWVLITRLWTPVSLILKRMNNARCQREQCYLL